MAVKKRKISPRKSPKQDRSQVLVEAILTAAARILVRSGYDGSTTNKIAEVAGVSIGSLYQYFPNKEALIGALIERQLGRHKELLQAKLRENEGRPFEELIDVIIQVVVELFMDNRALLRSLFELAPRLDRLKTVLATRKAIGALFTQLLKAQPARVRPKNIPLAVYVALHSVMGVVQTAVLDSSEIYTSLELKGELSDLVKNYILR